MHEDAKLPVCHAGLYPSQTLSAGYVSATCLRRTRNSPSASRRQCTRAGSLTGKTAEFAVAMSRAGISAVSASHLRGSMMVRDGSLPDHTRGCMSEHPRVPPGAIFGVKRTLMFVCAFDRQGRSVYERPEAPELVITTLGRSVDGVVTEILSKCQFA